MDKNFLKRKTEAKGLSAVVLSVGTALALLTACMSFAGGRSGETGVLQRKGAGEGSYEQKMIARIEGGRRIPLTVTVEERNLTKKEIDEELSGAATLLPELLKGENESLQKVTKELNFVGNVSSMTEVNWQTDAWDYFSADMTRRKDVRITEPVPVVFLAVLSCQGQEMEVPVEAILFPQEETPAERLSAQVAEESGKTKEKEELRLPQTCGGKKVSWKKPLDFTFLYIFALTLSAAALLKFGKKRDEEAEKQKEREELERAYAGLVSKFTMLLSAGLSIRNAWERIVVLYRNNADKDGLLCRELSRSFREMQQGVPELEVYERFGARTGMIHYKKLMQLFISDKRRGSIPLLEALDREMLEAWEEKKRMVRQRGEKTETKLLVPMMGMLSVVFMIILIPAFMSFNLIK